MTVSRISWNNSSLSQPSCVMGKRVSNTGIARQCARQTADRLMPNRSSHPVTCLVCILFIAGFIPQSFSACLGLPLKSAWHKRSKLLPGLIHRARFGRQSTHIDHTHASWSRAGGRARSRTCCSESESDRHQLYLLGGYLAGRRYFGDRFFLCIEGDIYRLRFR